MDSFSISSYSPLDFQRILVSRIKSRDDSMMRLATGQRVNRAADDPAVLMISQAMLADLAGFQSQVSALERTDHVASTADGALEQVSDLLSQANALALANANDAGVSAEERQANQLQIDSILSTVNRLTGGASFAGQALFDGSVTLGSGSDAVALPALSTSTLGQATIDGQPYSLADVGSGGALSTSGGDAAGAQQVIAAAQSQITLLRGRIGGYQAYTLQPQLQGMQTAMENLAAANSQIIDTDFAEETASLTRDSVLVKASILVLNKKNKMQGTLLSLLA